MQSFACEGWLHITIRDFSDVALVKLVHKESHIHYWPIDIPKDVVDYVRNNAHLTPTQVRENRQAPISDFDVYIAVMVKYLGRPSDTIIQAKGHLSDLVAR